MFTGHPDLQWRPLWVALRSSPGDFVWVIEKWLLLWLLLILLLIILLISLIVSAHFILELVQFSRYVPCSTWSRLGLAVSYVEPLHWWLVFDIIKTHFHILIHWKSLEEFLERSEVLITHNLRIGVLDIPPPILSRALTHQPVHQPLRERPSKSRAKTKGPNLASDPTGSFVKIQNRNSVSE